jgi:hypothetical protein
LPGLELKTENENYFSEVYIFVSAKWEPSFYKKTFLVNLTLDTIL